LQAQHDQGGQDSVGEGQPVAWAGPGGTATRMPAALPQGGLVGGGPRVGELDDQLARSRHPPKSSR
jgi:hypothetical protein